MDIIEVIKSLRDVVTLPALDINSINEAQDILNVKFAHEFVVYSKQFGAVSADNIELFGITNHKRLSVVENTIQQREFNKSFPDNMYVIEDAGIEGIVIAQNEKGEIYQVSLNGATYVTSSLANYLQNKSM